MPVSLRVTEGKLQVPNFHFGKGQLERIRAGGVGLGGIFRSMPGLVRIAEEGKGKIVIEGKEYLVETALKAEVSIVHAKKGRSHLGI